MQSNGAILVLSGPSGAGKSTVIERAAPYIGAFYFSISTTTRQPRTGEVHGREYYFVDKARFEAGIEAGEFLEYAEVHGNYYGTSLAPVKEALEAGKLVIFDIDVQGHRLARERLGEIVTSVFITPPSIGVLEARLRARGSDDEETIAKRLRNAAEEIAALEEYDFVIVNDDIDAATNAFIAVANASRYRPSYEKRAAFREQWLHN